MAKANSQPGRRVQLHRAISKLGWGSRTQAWDWIRAGEVSVDGRVVTDPLAWVDLTGQHVTRAGQVAKPVAARTLALHKPRGIVTTRQDEHGRRTVYDLLPADLPWLFPVGRLDADSEGLLILTNDSGLSTHLTEPNHRVPKTYRVTVRGAPIQEIVEQLRQGIELSDGLTRPVGIEVLKQHANETTVSMVLTEGRNRQIRRMWSAVGHRVKRLVRIAIGDYELGDLPAGANRELSDEDVRRLTRSTNGLR